jgi:hypothetical protein
MSTINRVRRSKGFTTIPDAALRDERLSYRARGILAVVLSHSDGWVGGAEWFAEHGPEGREAVATALRELEAAGYRTVTRSQDERGRWTTTVEWFDTSTTAANPAPGNPYPGAPGGKDLGNHQGTKTKTPPTPPAGGEQPALIAVEEPVVKRQRRDNRVPLPDTWEPPKESWSFARDVLPGRNLQLVLDAFIAHAHANDRRQADWNAAWRAWLVNEAKFAERRKQA